MTNAGPHYPRPAYEVYGGILARGVAAAPRPPSVRVPAWLPEWTPPVDDPNATHPGFPVEVVAPRRMVNPLPTLPEVLVDELVRLATVGGHPDPAAYAAWLDDQLGQLDPEAVAIAMHVGLAVVADVEATPIADAAAAAYGRMPAVPE